MTVNKTVLHILYANDCNMFDGLILIILSELSYSSIELSYMFLKTVKHVCKTIVHVRNLPTWVTDSTV